MSLTPDSGVKGNSVAVAIATAILLSLGAFVDDSTAEAFELRAAGVEPATAYFAGKPLKIRFRAADERERRLRLLVIEKRSGKKVYRERRQTTAALTRFRFRWRGKLEGGRIARNGRYAVRAGPVGRPARRVGTFAWRRHAYPIDGPHADRGPVGEFGAGRSGGRIHEGFDVNAACGTPLVAARGGKVLKSRFDARLMGHFVIIRGRRDRFRYLYAHLRDRSPLRTGERVRTNQIVGYVGQTGNASSTPCHLHFELRDGGPVDPEPFLRRWDR